MLQKILLGWGSAIGLFLSLWIVIPAPIMSLLPLSVGAPEVSPWLIGANLLLVVFAGVGVGSHKIHPLILLISLLGLGLSTLPLSQLFPAHQQATVAFSRTLGENYLTQIPAALRAQMRPTPFRLLDAFQGIPSRPVRYTANLPWTTADGRSLTLDLYRPSAPGNYPALVIIHGGAWQRGSPTDHADFSRYMAAQGYAVWAVTYRFAPRYQFPSQLEDVKAALDFIQHHGAEYETDPSRIALLGRSAGAQLAMVAAYQPDAMPIRAVVGYYGPVNLAAGYANPPVPDPINTRPILEAFLGGTPSQVPERYQDASPIHYVTRPLPLTLLVYGGKDHIVQASYGQALYERLKSVDSRAIFLEIPWADHAFDTLFQGVSNQLALYYTERFLAAVLYGDP